MLKYLVFIIGLLLTNFSFSQIKNEDTVRIDNHEYTLFKPSEELRATIQNGLQIRYALIKLKTHPSMNLSDKEYQSYTRLMDTLIMHEDIVFVDSVSIVLKNGLSWKLNGNPPAEPKNFYSKVTTKKGQERKAIIDRLKYLQFCYSWKKKGEFPREMVDKFIDYQRIEINNVKYLETSYELKFNKDNSTSFSKKEIMIRSDIE